MHCDVVIIGAGAVGSSTAFQMAEAGLKVTLVDRSFPGGGTSRTTQAGIGVYAKKPRANLEMNMKGAELYPSLVARLGADVELRMDGVLNVALTDEALVKMRAFVAKQHETPGYKADLVTGDEARAMEPALSPEVKGAAFCPLDGSVNSLLYVNALARGAARLGARVLAWTEVHGITPRGERRWCVSTSAGEIEAPWVVSATGTEAPRIGAMVGVDIPIQPNRGHVLVTEAIPPLIRRRLSGPTLIRQNAHGTLLLGQNEELVGYEPAENLAHLAAAAAISRRVLPGLAKVRIIRSFVGFRPWPPDGLPIMGEIPGLPGFLTAVGHSGITWSPAAGKLLTELVTTGKTCLPLAPYSLARFSRNAN
ncbi:MAG TPA: FAD-dependent oxidoreductase [Candidatus Sulfotelmatobacter sp.]|nr:FAD-dependent oxidoreductase [Candidatus Sulfotelmatobacter sp.]